MQNILPEQDADRICHYVFCCPSGISEGSPLSPAISNIYLRNFDQEMSLLPDTFYIRYCDDILFLTNLNVERTRLFTHIEHALLDRGLSINMDKLDIGFVPDGICFLGYIINRHGIMIQPEKVIEIIERLESAANPKKRKKIASGFRAYYRNPLFLPICQPSIDYLNAYGDDDEINAFADMMGTATGRRPL